MLHLSCWARSRADGLECISLGSRPPLRRLARLRVLVLSSSLNCNTARKFLDSCLMMTVSCTFGRLDGDLSVYKMAITPRHKPFSGIPFGAKPQWRASRACGSNISFVIIYWMAKKTPNVLASTRQCPWDNDMASSSQLWKCIRTLHSLPHISMICSYRSTYPCPFCDIPAYVRRETSG